jgi:uncharacterized protein YndB with AHSA1/START domain
MIIVKTSVNAPLKKAWEYWTQPQHIINWNFASDDWHCPKAENNLNIGKEFSYTMATKNGEMSFDFQGIYTNINEFTLIEYEISDGRKVIISFKEIENNVEITESFEPENIHPEELQQQGWQAILDNFKKYVESK